MPYGEFHSFGQNASTCVAGWFTAKLPRGKTSVKVGSGVACHQSRRRSPQSRSGQCGSQRQAGVEGQEAWILSRSVFVR